MKKILTFFWSGLFFLSFGEQVSDNLTQYDRLSIYLHNGEEYIIPIDTTSQVKSFFVDKEQFIDVLGVTANYHFSREEVKKISWIASDDQSIIESLFKIDTRTSQVRIEGNMIIFGTSLIGKYASFYSISGKMVYRLKIDNTCRFDIRNLGRGAYTMRAENNTLKLIVR